MVVAGTVQRVLRHARVYRGGPESVIHARGLQEDGTGDFQELRSDVRGRGVEEELGQDFVVQGPGEGGGMIYINFLTVISWALGPLMTAVISISFFIQKAEDLTWISARMLLLTIAFDCWLVARYLL